MQLCLGHCWEAGNFVLDWGGQVAGADWMLAMCGYGQRLVALVKVEPLRQILRILDKFLRVL